ncbi:GNAT family N-acetyltransferase [Radicibacter daui]|uniref:GNAT family N-acetyltransferase n=1 Tax=Radicibacter daui TaxID=3064829 RepID=UPI004046B390
MPDQTAAVTLRLVSALSEVPAADWDRCAGNGNPFLSHAFLQALEESGSVSAETGWLPQHLVLEDESGRLVGAVPLYLKSHSAGEYVFDHGWADAYERAGGRYYPKLQSCVPFTPVPGPRLLVAPDAPEGTRSTLIAGLEKALEVHGASSLHITFPEEEDWQALGAAGWLQRIGHQYHWHNDGYGSFEDFLGALNSRKRKAIRKERREVAESGIRLLNITGSELTEAHWDAFFEFYMDTGSRKWGRPYLNREFFSLIGERMADRILLVMAQEEGRFVGGALNLIGSDALYGRNWGCLEHVKFLHFEACYYRAIDFAIERGLARVEAGAQGEHKVQRGYLPVATYSAHLIADPALSAPVAQFLARERRAELADIEAMRREWSPFRHTEGGGPDACR